MGLRIRESMGALPWPNSRRSPRARTCASSPSEPWSASLRRWSPRSSRARARHRALALGGLPDGSADLASLVPGHRTPHGRWGTRRFRRLLLPGDGGHRPLDDLANTLMGTTIGRALLRRLAKTSLRGLCLGVLCGALWRNCGRGLTAWWQRPMLFDRRAAAGRPTQFDSDCDYAGGRLSIAA